MDICFPAQTLPLFHVFAPCCTAPSFAYCPSSLWALRVVEGRQGLTRLARGACFPQRALSSWERCLAEHRGSLTAVTQRLVTLVVAQLGARLPVHQADLVGPDTTVVAKPAKRMLGVQTWQDHSANADRGGSLVGHHGHRVGLRSPWESRWRCWPRGLRLVPGRQGARQWSVGATVETRRCGEAALAALLEVTPGWGEAAGRVVAEAFSSKAPGLHGLRARGLHLVSRLRKDAGGGDDPALPSPGTRGRKPRSGRTWTLASLLTAETPSRDRLPLDGKRTAVVCVVRDVWRRDVVQQVRVVGRAGAKAPVLLVSPVLTLSALQLDRDLWGERRDRADPTRLATPWWPGRFPVDHHAGQPALRALGLWRLVPVAAGSPRAPGGWLAPGALVAGVPAGSPPELPAGPPGPAGVGHPAGALYPVRSWGGLGTKRAGS
jgi:hypothetical protein